MSMLFNNLKIAFRYLVKNPTFSVINVAGLTLGFLCFLLIALYLYDEVNFDLFHKDSTLTYRVIQNEQQENGETRFVAPVSARLGPEAVNQVPEVQDAAYVTALGRITVGNDPVNRDYERTITVSPNFFSFFDFKLLEGNPETALSQPDGVVLSEKLAKKYFGNEPALGKRLWSILRRDDKYVELEVTGIMKDFPKNSHLQFDMLFTESTWPRIFEWYQQFVTTDWSSNTIVTYIKIKPGADQKVVETKLTALVKANYPADREFKSTFSIQPLKEIHLYSDNIQGQEINTNGINPFYLYLFTAVALLILLIACLNYMNLSTAAAYQRTREIGTRKTLGAHKGQLIMQFTGESVLLSVISLALAVALLQVILPGANVFTQKQMSLQALPMNWILLLVFIMGSSGILASLYPAFVIAKVKPSDALRKEVRLGNRSLPIRKLLVASQFAISIMMIASTIVIYQQLKFMRTKELGFELGNLLVVDINSDKLRRNFETVKAEFASIGEVQQISTSTRVPGEWKSFPVATVKGEGEPTGQEMIYVGIDQDFLGTYNIRLLEGRNFTSGPGDSTKVILTKLAAEQLGLKDPLGKVIEIPTVRWGGSITQLDRVFRAEVIGIADNFHFESFRQKMMPIVFAYPNTPIQRIDYYTLRIKTDRWSETIDKLKTINTKIDLENPLEYTLLDNRFEEFYSADEKRGQIFLTFSLVIVVIACLGLFALVSYSIESRTKEIGIRKVLGASVAAVVGMVSREFLLIVLVSSLVAVPAAWYLMHIWLQDFAYQVNFGPASFAMAVFLALVIAFGTISLRAIRAATANPVDSLRSE